MSKHNALTTFGRTGNPMFRGEAFKPDATFADSGTVGRMTLAGTVNKTGILLVLCLITASFTWNIFFRSGDPAAVTGLLWIGLIGGLVLCLITASFTWNIFFRSGDPATVTGLLWIGLIGGLVLALITIFKRQWAGITAPLYALAEGLALGGISAMFEAQYPGIVIQAMGLTFGTLGILLLAYKSGLIKPTENFRLMIVAATGGIAVLYLVSFVMGFFGSSIGFIHSNGLFGIGFSLFVVAIAALSLVLDFDFIEEAAERGAPKYLEWYGAFSLMVTLIWLYLEILRLLAKLRGRN